MPFVPLRQRKPIPLVLDSDKEILAAKQRERDNSAIQRHFGEAPGASGYRFANHPQTFGHVRGPEMPFQKGHSPWRPPSADPDGPATRRADDHAKYGAFHTGAHGLRKVRSTPAMASPTAGADIKEACHPLSTELRRWEKLAATTKRCDMPDREDVDFEFPRKPQPKPDPPKAPPPRTGLVMFPKYMLLNNCHLKQQDLQRFQREQQEAQRRAAEEAEAAEAQSRADSFANSVRSQAGMGNSMRLDASWGNPRLNEASPGGPHWAGSALPAGRNQRTSNPFRQG